MEHQRSLHTVIFGDGSALAVIGLTFAGWLPDIASGFAILWYALTIFESRTIKAIRQWLVNKFGG